MGNLLLFVCLFFVLVNRITAGQPKRFILPPKCCASLHCSSCRTFTHFPFQPQFLDKQTRMSLGDKTGESLVLNTGRALWLSALCQGAPLPQLSVQGRLLVAVDEDVSTVEAVMLPRRLMLCFILHTFQSITPGLWALCCGCAGAISASNSCVRALWVSASAALVQQDHHLRKQNCTPRNKVPFLCSTCSVLLKDS